MPQQQVGSQSKVLRPFAFHGINFISAEGVEQAQAESCPFCGAEGKLYVNSKDGRWQCWKCHTGNDKGGGNLSVFLQMLWDASDKATVEYDDLAKDRKLMYPETLAYWGLCKSVITGHWLVPGYNVNGNIGNLYRRIKVLEKDNWIWKLIPTPELNHHLHGVNLLDPKKPNIVVCEGPWDGMVLWEAMRSAKLSETGGLALTGAEAASLLADTNVVAVPGCGIFSESWLQLFAGKKVILAYDSDHPRRLCKKCQRSFSTLNYQVCPTCRGELEKTVIEPAGYVGMKRASYILAGASEPPSEIHYLCWGKDGYDPGEKSGYDVRDYLGGDDQPGPRIAALDNLLKLVKPIPSDWIAGRTAAARRKGSVEMELLPCSSWTDLQMSWKRSMKWTEGLDRALSVMLACIISTKTVGSQLWCRIMGPPSCGKSTLCEALSVNRKYIYPKDTITGLLSGYQMDKEGSENLSLVEKLRDKTLVIKDGDTILKEPGIGKILSQFRAFYDRSIRSQYGNKMSSNHESINATVILCGTSALRQLDSSDLGERFFSCSIMEGINEELEEEVNWRAANRIKRNMAVVADGDLRSQHDPDLISTMQLTGGYINHLRTNSDKLLAGVTMDDDATRKCINLATFVAYMRARPSGKQSELAERELSTRLVEQYVKLAICLAPVIGRTTVDSEVMRRVRRLALDTAQGRTLDTTKHLYNAGSTGLEIASLAVATGQATDYEWPYLRFLKKIGAVEVIEKKLMPGLRAKPRWRPSNKVSALYKEVMS